MKKKLIDKVHVFVLAIGAGIAIGIGSLIYIKNPNVYGAFFFSFGLLTVFGVQLKLYTGMIGYGTLHNIDDLVLAFIGNAVGASAMSVFGPIDSQIMMTKLTTPWYLVIAKGIGCGIIIYLCVREHKAGRTWFTLFGIPAFILCGFEHCIADIGYTALTGTWTWEAWGFIGLVAIGNSIGSIVTHRVLTTLEVGKHE